MNQTEILKYLEGQKTTRKITDLIVQATTAEQGHEILDKISQLLSLNKKENETTGN